MYNSIMEAKICISCGEEKNLSNKERIDLILKTLPYREREVIKLRYGIGDGYIYTLKEVGRIFKVTPEQVRYVEAKAIKKMRVELMKELNYARV